MTDSKQITLNAQERETFGKSVRSMRKNGLLPANIYGSHFPSQAVTVDTKEFFDVFKEAGETGIIYVKLGGKSIPTLLTNIQYHPVEETMLHVDLRKVDLKKKIEAHVPFKIVGESEAVEQKDGVLITQMDHITVEALPADIPHEIEVDVSQLKEIGDTITVGSLPKSDKYTYQVDDEHIIVSVTQHVEENIEPETVTEAPEITTEAAEDMEAGEGTEGTEAETETTAKEAEENKE